MNIQIDSRKIKKGDTFIALKGHDADGHNYIEKAIENGASTIICEHGSYAVKTIIVKSTKDYLNVLLEKQYKTLIKDMKFIGITGTNGKTTSAYLVYQMLNMLKTPTAFIGTNGFYLNNEIIELSNTTPDAVELYYLIEKAKKKNIKTIILEVSSHALMQDRILGFNLDIAAFTNLTQDHLDYHKTMDKYLEAKLLILNKLNKNGKIIVNIDDPNGIKFCNGKEITIGQNGNDYKITNIVYNDSSTTINFLHNKKEYVVTTLFNNLFNVYNYLTALAIVNTYGYSIEDIINITNNLLLPKGRCETVNYNSNKIVVDYAHTPDAVKQVINSYKKICKGNLITLLGCTGDRDKEKRPIMASIATQLSNKVIFTDDDLHNEERSSIQKDMIPGIKKDNYIFIYDRKNAIKEAINMLNKNDILLILGMGHQEFTYVQNKKIPHNDMAEVLKNINLI